MRKVLLSMATALAIMSCQQEELSVNSDETPNYKSIQLVQIIDGTHIESVNKPATESVDQGEQALRFDSESTYQSFLDRIKNMPSKERIALVQSYGLTSLQEIATIADKELDSIGTTASSETDFRTRYNNYKEKYEEVLISNKYTSEDLSLYVPDGDNLATYVLGQNHSIVIGNKVTPVSLSNDMSKSEKAVYTPKAQTRASANEASGKYVHNDAQKTTYAVELRQNTMLNVHVGFQKKMWYGWKRDNARDAYYFLDASPFQYNYWLKPNASDAPIFQVNINRPDVYFFDTPGTIDYESGYIVGGSRVLSGKLYVWTDYTVGTELVFYNLVIKGNTMYTREQMPKCDKAKAYVLDFTVNYLW